MRSLGSVGVDHVAGGRSLGEQLMVGQHGGTVGGIVTAWTSPQDWGEPGGRSDCCSSHHRFEVLLGVYRKSN